MIALAAAAALALSAQDVPLVPVVVELEGPLRAARVELAAGAGAPETRASIQLELRAGERRSVVVPAAAQAPGALRAGVPEVVRATVEGEGAAEAVLVGDPRDHGRPDVLRARAVPPVAPGRGPARPTVGVLALLAAAIPLAVGLRRRPGAQLAVGVGLAAVLAYAARPAAAPEAAPLRILEAGLGSEPEAWTVREVRSGRVELPALEVEGGRWAGGVGLSLASPGGAAPAAVEVTWRDGEWALELPRGGLLLERRLDVGMRLLRPEINTFGAFAEAWARGADGAWSSRGPWPIAEGLGEPVEVDGGGGGGGAPPGWLAAALPQGVAVFVGRLGAGAWSGPGFGREGGGAGPEPVGWVRLVGFGGR